MSMTRGQISVLPTPGGALYEPPNPQRTAKSCSNCGMWSEDSFCALFGDKTILSFDVCGYHVASSGPPRKRRIRLPIIPLDPVLAGLAWAPRGTRCGTCNHFRAEDKGTQGICVRVRQEKRVALARVESYGCCSLYAGPLVVDVK